MQAKFLDILHSVIHVAYKCVESQNIANVPQITELERVLYKQKNQFLCKKKAK